MRLAALPSLYKERIGRAMIPSDYEALYIRLMEMQGFSVIRIGEGSSTRYHIVNSGTGDEYILTPPTFREMFTEQVRRITHQQPPVNLPKKLPKQRPQIPPDTPMYIYALTDPRDASIRYIGLSANPKIRYSQHLHDKVNRAKWVWIRELVALGLKPGLESLEETTADKGKDRERHWIEDGRKKGWALVNGI